MMIELRWKRMHVNDRGNAFGLLSEIDDFGFGYVLQYRKTGPRSWNPETQATTETFTPWVNVPVVNNVPIQEGE